jgi:hypothetical protein
MTTAPVSTREHIVERLAVDLIGPRAPDEALLARASDIYLTGILWPRNTEIAPEEDERLAQAPGKGDDGDDAADAAVPAAVSMRRPSTAGVSFAVASDPGRTPEVEVDVRFAQYDAIEEEAGTRWRRRAVEPAPILVELDPALKPDIPLALGPPGLRLNRRIVPFSGGHLVTITLVNDATPEEPGREAIEAVTLFQVSLAIRSGKHTRLIARPRRRTPLSDEDFSGALIYRHAREYAVGHTCSADWTRGGPEPDAPVLEVRSTWLPQAVTPDVSGDGHPLFEDLGKGENAPLSAAWLAAANQDALGAGLERLCAAYESWIALKKTEAKSLAGKEWETADRHLRAAENVLGRMRAGVDRLRKDAEAAEAFCLANQAMNRQRMWGAKKPLFWRPFQLGFMLLALESTIDGSHDDRGVMDLLWFPTGGGKTEAYLGLVALVAFHRRLRTPTQPDAGAGVAVIMRYTLRLLTSQQFVRAAAMISACELIRRSDVARLGATPISIGLWVGEGATPNTREKAFEQRFDQSLSSPRQLVNCPCCRQKLDYVQARSTDAVHCFCRTESCDLADGRPLPVWAVDEDIYVERPTLLIGTIDKFALIVRRPATSALFGVGTGAQPQLVLQDELHLIAGPLGTIAGLFEAALDLILSHDGAAPKIIGSTATIRGAEDQVRDLFDRRTCQFPPPGLSADDSGFAVAVAEPTGEEGRGGRRYVGVTTAGRSAKFTLQAVAASLMHTAGVLDPSERDVYWTLVTYFNSLRELGGALVLMQDDVNDSLKLLSDLRTGEARRHPQIIEELTSRLSQDEVRDMLDRLENTSSSGEALDAVLASNMLSVGVDISRLGLMAVNGQPKTIAEYIQATSRVGRNGVRGLVVALLNNAKPRDRSHYETFRTWHETLYRDVEATSVTPFASRARDRALHAVLVAVIRHLIPAAQNRPVLDAATITAAEGLIDKIATRAACIDPQETQVRADLIKLLRRWIARAPAHYWTRHNTSLLQSDAEAAAKRATGRAIGAAWPTPTSMRGVEPASPYRLAEYLKGGR